MRSFIQRHRLALDRLSSFLLGVGLGGWLLSGSSTGIVIAWALLMVAAGFRAYLSTVFTQATEQSG